MTLLDKDWSDVLQLDISIESFLDNMNSILDEHAPLKKLNKYKLKFKSKPWLIPAINKSITVKNSLLKSFINAKIQTKNKSFIGKICYLHFFKKSKSNYYNQYFRANMNNIKSTWNGIKSIITIKNLSYNIPKSLLYNGLTITNKVEISYIFNNSFAAVAEKTKKYQSLTQRFI